MKIVKILLGLLATVTLLAGGFMAGTFIAQTRLASAPGQPFAQPTFIAQQIQPTLVPQEQIQPTVIPQQFQAPSIPQTTPLANPPQGQWGSGWWMMDPNYVPQGDWERSWMMDPNYAPQGQQGGCMHDWDYDNCGGRQGDMYDGQTNPNWNLTPPVPSSSPSYPTPSGPVSFQNNVQPIFAARCVACHGGTNGLYLDTYENVMKGGRNGAMVVPGDVYNSRLAYYVYNGYMPFKNTPLTAVEIQTILDWIAVGVPNN